MSMLVLAFVLLTARGSAEPVDIDIPLTPGHPFNLSQQVAPKEDVTLNFLFNVSYTPRLTTTLTPDGSGASVAFLISDACTASAFSLPLSVNVDGCLSYEGSRSICQQACSMPGQFSLSLSSFARHNVSIAVDLEDISLLVDVPKSVRVRSYAPIFLRYDYAESSRIHFQVRSTSHSVAIVSIQNQSCPVFDLPDNVAFQVMTLIGLNEIWVAPTPRHSHRSKLTMTGQAANLVHASRSVH